MRQSTSDKRIKRLRRRLKACNIDALIVSNPSDLFYLTGFPAEGCIALVSAGSVGIFAPAMLYNQVKDFTDGFEVINSRNNLLGALKKRAAGQEVRRIAFEQSAVPYRFYIEFIRKFREYKVISKCGLVKSMRLIKDNDEIRLIKKSAGICKRAFRYIGKNLKPGKSEKELAAGMEWYFKGNCGRDVSFSTIVASGANSAYPHHVPGERRIKKDDIIVVDSGCRYEGYSSDLTRTFFLGNIHKLNFKNILSTVRKAQREAIKRIKPGVHCSSLYRKAYGIIDKAGYGKYFIHGLGHGVGIDVHEKPYINSGSRDVLKQGMVITIEPGIYVPGMGGVRLEDMVLVTEEGCMVL